MSANSLSVPFPIFNDVDGDPLDAGYIYVGTTNLDPETNPISVYFDAALTIPAPQPIRTINGFPSNSGSPARLYVDAENYSITVRNKNSTLVYTSLVSTDRIPFSVVSGQIPASRVDYLAPFAGSVVRSGDVKLSDVVNVADFGAVGDEVTDDTVAIQTALNSGASGVQLDGSFLVTGNLTVPAGVTLYGSNPKTDRLVPSGSGYDVVTLGGDYASVIGVGFASSVERTGGAYIGINGTYRGNKIKDFLMSNGFNGIHISAEAVITIISDGEILDCKDALGTGILIDGGNDTFISKVVMDSTGTEPFCGIRIKHSQATWITDTDVIDFGIPLLIDPDGAASDLVTWCFFNGLALDTSDGNGIQIAPTNGATVKGLFFDNCWSSTNNRGVLIQPTSSGVVDTVHFTDCTLYNNQLQGALVDNAGGTINHVEFNNCRAAGNSQAASGVNAGFDFGNNSNNFAVRGCFAGAQAGFAGSQSYGVLIGATCDNYIITDNHLSGNITGAYADNSFATAASKVVNDNLGFLTENTGVASLSAATSLVINHGLLGKPQTIQVTPLNTNLGFHEFWAGTLTGTTFTLHTSAPLTGTFSWRASM